MKCTVLLDNHCYIDRYYLGEPAVSYLIEDGARTILFDTGYSDVFMENAKRMAIDLSKVTDIVLSHGHNDHTGGLPAFVRRFSQKLRLYAHAEAFFPKRAQGLDIGAPSREAELPKNVSLQLTREPCQISEHVRFMGQIERVYDFENGRAIGERFVGGAWETDTLADDSAVLLTLADGVFIVTGCAHSGICNTAAQALRIGGGRPIKGILGGFHLFEAGETLRPTLDTLEELGVRMVYPCHCTSLEVKCAFASRFDTCEVGVGMVLVF